MNPFEKTVNWALDTASPSAIRPIIEYAMNTNAFGQNIYNPFYSKYGSAYGGSDNMPQLYKDFSIWLAESTKGEIDWSPSTLAFFANNYGDAVFRLSHDMYGLQLTMRGQKEFDAKRDTVFFDSFLSKASDIEQREYSDAVKKIENENRRLSLFKDTNPMVYNEVIAENPAILATIEQYNKMKSALNKLNQRGNEIRKMQGLSPKQRKDLLEQIKTQQLMYKRSIARMIEMGLYSED
jgi:hypothetical protein